MGTQPGRGCGICTESYFTVKAQNLHFGEPLVDGRSAAMFLFCMYSSVHMLS